MRAYVHFDLSRHLIIIVTTVFITIFYIYMQIVGFVAIQTLNSLEIIGSFLVQVIFVVNAVNIEVGRGRISPIYFFIPANAMGALGFSAPGGAVFTGLPTRPSNISNYGRGIIEVPKQAGHTSHGATGTEHHCKHQGCSNK